MLTCLQLSELATDYYEGRLSFGMKLQFWVHRLMCPHCARYLRQIRLSSNTVGNMKNEGHLSEPEIEDLVRNINKRMGSDS